MLNLKLHTCLCLLLLLVSAQAEAPWPTVSWPRSAPAKQRMDSLVLHSLDRDFAEGRLGLVDDFLVIRHGFIVFQRHYQHDYQSLSRDHPKSEPKSGPYNYRDPRWHPYHGDGSPHTLQSVTKSVTSALVGVALQKGDLDSIDLKVYGQFFTLRQLLNMTSGLKWDEESAYGDPGNDWSEMEKSQDWVAYTLGKGFSHKPGAYFNYNSGATVLVAQYLKNVTAQHIDTYAQEYLFTPLGITTYFWKKSPTGLPDAQGGLYLHPRDLAKIGLLYLRDGVWEKTRLLPPGWVQDSMTAVQADNLEDWKYGLGWWLLPCQEGSAHVCLGYGGQKMILLPKSDVIVVTTGWNLFGDKPLSTNKLLERIEAAIKE